MKGGPIQKPQLIRDDCEYHEQKMAGGEFPPIVVVDEIPHFRAEMLSAATALVDGTDGKRRHFGHLFMRKGPVALYAPLGLETIDMVIRNLTQIRDQMVSEEAASAGKVN